MSMLNSMTRLAGAVVLLAWGPMAHAVEMTLFTNQSGQTLHLTKCLGGPGGQAPQNMRMRWVKDGKVAVAPITLADITVPDRTSILIELIDSNANGYSCVSWTLADDQGKSVLDGASVSFHKFGFEKQAILDLTSGDVGKFTVRVVGPTELEHTLLAILPLK